MILLTAAGDTVEVPDQPTDPDHPNHIARRQISYLVTMTGADGREWNLNSGPVQLLAGVKGLWGMAPIDPWTSTSPYVAGSRWAGEHTDELPMTLPVRTMGKDWEDWRATDRAFFRSLRAGATLTVTAPDGIAYSIGIRYLTDGEPEDDIDPLILTKRRYSGLGVVAPWPFWRGQDVVQRFTFEEELAFFDVAEPVINAGGDSDQATISNPGDVESWALYEVAGPQLEWSVGARPDAAAGPSVVSSTKVPVGSGRIHIDSRPGAKTVTDQNGDRVRLRDFDQVGFRAIPPGDDIPIVASMAGHGPGSEIVVVLPTWYRRPV